MRGLFGKYEVEIRLGLIVIVVLLLFLNFNTAYILHSIKKSLVTDIDLKLESGLNYGLQYVKKNNLSDVDTDQAAAIKQRYNVEFIGIFPLRDTTGVTIFTPDKNSGPRLGQEEMTTLLSGRIMYYSHKGSVYRYGFKVTTTAAGERMLTVCRIDAHRMNTIAAASRRVLYLAIVVLVLIVPLVIGLPRLILRPFRTMREQAQSAGKLTSTGGRDEVDDVIRSYEGIIEELKRHEQELERLYHESSHKAHRLETLNDYILKSIGSGVIVVDLTGKVIGYNRAASEILGYDETTVLDKNYLVAFPHDMELCLVISSGLERGEVCSRKEFQSPRPDGCEKWLGAESALIHDNRECVIGLALLIAEMTEVKKLHAELEVNRQMAALGEMTGGLAHQLRNSLAAISGFCQLLHKKTKADTSLNDIADTIRTEAASSSEMVSRFLSFARPLSLCVENVDLGKVLDECRTKIAPDAATRKVTIEQETCVRPVIVGGDYLLLKEAISNVLANAVQASNEGDVVRIRLGAAGERAEVIISDDGPGIAPSIKDKLFTPFVSSKPSGTGLGLALTRKIINLHHGTIVLESRSPHGTDCRIGIPLAVAGRAAEACHDRSITS
jgi:PAS domain S-box-containing protein